MFSVSEIVRSSTYFKLWCRHALTHIFCTLLYYFFTQPNHDPMDNKTWLSISKIVIISQLSYFYILQKGRNILVWKYMLWYKSLNQIALHFRRNNMLLLSLNKQNKNHSQKFPTVNAVHFSYNITQLSYSPTKRTRNKVSFVMISYSSTFLNIYPLMFK